MPSRRTLLTGAGVAAASAVAGCSTLDSDGSLHDAEHGTGPRPPEEATVVATSATSLDAEPNGAFAVRATAFERARSGGGRELLVDTDLRLIPGRNRSTNDWTMAGFTLEHDYQALDLTGPVDHEGSYVLAGADGGDSKIRMAREHRRQALPQTSRWRVRYDRNGSTWGPTFRTRLPVGESLADGDDIARACLWARTRRWPFGSDERKLTTRLVYGEDRRE